MEYTEEFEEWWDSSWTPSDGCRTLDEAFKEVAFRAWLAAIALSY